MTWTAERLAILRLARSANLGPVTQRALMERYGDAASAVDALEVGLVQGRIVLAGTGSIKKEIEETEHAGARILVLGDPDFPALIAALDPPPPVLSVLGQPDILSQSLVAIVGARNASANGRKMAAILARGLGKAGCVVVSGLARGIDAAAHEAALETGTVAVLAGGVDQPYPDQHKELYERIAQTGAVVSEMPLGHVARAADFPRRNRIISGLSRGTVVVEAAERSGSLITARLAAEQGRDVFAVPGSPLDPRCRGTNQLLKDGAILTESATDVTAHLQQHIMPRQAPARQRAVVLPVPKPVLRSVLPDGSTPEAGVLGLLGPSPILIDELVRMTGLAPAALQAMLLDLEIEGLIVRHPGPAVSAVTAG